MKIQQEVRQRVADKLLEEFPRLSDDWSREDVLEVVDSLIEAAQSPNAPAPEPTEWPHPLAPRTVVPESADKTPRPYHGPAPLSQEDTMRAHIGDPPLPPEYSDTCPVCGAAIKPGEKCEAHMEPVEQGEPIEWQNPLPPRNPQNEPSQPELPPLIERVHDVDLEPWDIRFIAVDEAHAFRDSALREIQQLRQRCEELAEKYKEVAELQLADEASVKNLQQQLAQIREYKGERPLEYLCQMDNHGDLAYYEVEPTNTLLDQQDAQIAALRQDNAQKDARIAELTGDK